MSFDQHWLVHGLVYNETRAQAPFVLNKKDFWRIYFNDRDVHNRTVIKYIDVEAGNPTNVLSKCEKPLLEPGKLGSFDVHGTMMSCVVEEPDHLRMYYQGWAKRVDVPYYNSIGMALSLNGGSHFTKYAKGPTIGPIAIEDGFVGMPYVIKQRNIWICYYLHCSRWIETRKPNSEAILSIEPIYTINLATSNDGISWARANIQAIPPNTDHECIARASVLPTSNGYHMWYCYRDAVDYRSDPTKSYKIGHAFSQDGLMWERRDQVHFAIGDDSSWASLMRCYPHVIEHEGLLYMFYNGDGFGQSGFGYATLPSDML